MCSKRLIYFNVPTCSKLLFVASTTNLLFHVSFSASIRLMIFSLKIVLYIPLKFLYGKWSTITVIIIITSKPRGPYLPLFQGRNSSGLGGCVDSVKFGNPLPAAVSLVIN